MNKPPLQVSLLKEELRKRCEEDVNACTNTGRAHRPSSVQCKGFSNARLCQREHKQPQSLKNGPNKGGKLVEAQQRVFV